MPKSVVILIRFSQEEKYALEQLATEANLPISTFIRTTTLKDISKSSKAKSLLDLLGSLNLTNQEIQDADNQGENFRKNFKLTPTR